MRNDAAVTPTHHAGNKAAGSGSDIGLNQPLKVVRFWPKGQISIFFLNLHARQPCVDNVMNN